MNREMKRELLVAIVQQLDALPREKDDPVGRLKRAEAALREFSGRSANMVPLELVVRFAEQLDDEPLPRNPIAQGIEVLLKSLPDDVFTDAPDPPDTDAAEAPPMTFREALGHLLTAPAVLEFLKHNRNETAQSYELALMHAAEVLDLHAARNLALAKLGT